MDDSTQLDGDSTPPPASSAAGGAGWSLVPVDHDPFNTASTNGPSFSLVPVDHDPFAAGSSAQPQTSPNPNPPPLAGEGEGGGGAPNSQYQLSPLGNPGQAALPPNRGLPDSLLRVDLAGLRAAGYEIPSVTPVARNYGMPGGGGEMQFPYPIPAEFLQVVPR